MGTESSIPPKLASELERIVQDRKSGATELSRRAALLLSQLKDPLARRLASERLVEAKGMMAPIANLAALCNEAGEPEARLSEFADSLATAPSQAARETANWVLRHCTPPLRLVTFSASRVAETCLLVLHARNSLECVLVGEGAPGMEGRELARRMSAQGLRVILAYDVALYTSVGNAHAVVIGADAVLGRSFVNKSGTFALCLAAQYFHKPVAVSTTSHKVLAPRAEAFYRPPKGITMDVSNRLSGQVFVDCLFEEVPRDLATVIVTEHGPQRTAR